MNKTIIKKETYYKCIHCGDEIFWNTYKKMITCTCGTIYVDGCQDYVRIGGNQEDYKVKVWLAQTSYDSGIEFSGRNYQPTHHISPLVDMARDKVGRDLDGTGVVHNLDHAAFNHPIFWAHNGGNDYYESDGDMLVINFTTTPITLRQNKI